MVVILMSVHGGHHEECTWCGVTGQPRKGGQQHRMTATTGAPIPSVLFLPGEQEAEDSSLRLFLSLLRGTEVDNHHWVDQHRAG